MGPVLQIIQMQEIRRLEEKERKMARNAKGFQQCADKENVRSKETTLKEHQNENRYHLCTLE